MVGGGWWLAGTGGCNRGKRPESAVMVGILPPDTYDDGEFSVAVEVTFPAVCGQKVTGRVD